MWNPYPFMVQSMLLNDEQLGHYLAGLIDGDGHFSNKQLVLVFSSPDAFLAHYLKTILIHCRKVKDKKAYLLIVSAKKKREEGRYIKNTSFN